MGKTERPHSQENQPSKQRRRNKKPPQNEYDGGLTCVRELLDLWEDVSQIIIKGLKNKLCKRE